MKPKYDDGTITIYGGDCLKALKGIGAVDHMITDPPYGAHTHKNARTNPKAATEKKLELGFDHLPPRTRLMLAKWISRHVRRWSSLDWVQLGGSECT